MDEVLPERESRSHSQREWAEVMHDLRSPLTVIVGRVQLLRRHVRRGDDPQRVDDDLEALEAAVARLLAAVERLDRDGRRD